MPKVVHPSELLGCILNIAVGPKVKAVLRISIRSGCFFVASLLFLGHPAEEDARVVRIFFTLLALSWVL